MPWKSDQQRKWGNSPEGRKALGGQAKVNEWNEASKGIDLPKKVVRRKKKFSGTPYVVPARMN